jgi:hypothetical protein
MPTAKEVLKIGFTVVANKGGYVTKQAVKDNGWESKVIDGPDIGGTKLTTVPTKDEKAPKGRAQKGS